MQLPIVILAVVVAVESMRIKASIAELSPQHNQIVIISATETTIRMIRMAPLEPAIHLLRRRWVVAGGA